jgi:hypothetical protein
MILIEMKIYSKISEHQGEIKDLLKINNNTFIFSLKTIKLNLLN